MNIQCPLPITDYPKVLLAHGSGGTLMNQLIEKIFYPAFSNQMLDKGHDGAVIELDSKRVVMTTDSYVVDPIFFPGGDIGKLAIYGTTNDLAMCGAKPRYLSAGFIIEEGFSMDLLWNVVCSMKEAAEELGVSIVTGDTKVVEKGKGDGLFINTCGVGELLSETEIGPASIRTGDNIIISGDIGRHGIAIMASREGFEFEAEIQSDAAPLSDMVSALIDAHVDVHCFRDLTRGGLASALVEISKKSKKKIEIREKDIPLREDIKAACELLGFDPLYVANEGRCICFVPESDVDRTLEIMNRYECSQDASLFGKVVDSGSGSVFMKNLIGTSRSVEMLSGAQLPRIC